jgi:hypothetical protein
MSIPPELEGEPCPNCGKPIQVNTNWCPHCGYGTPNFKQGNSRKGKYPFGWIWFLVLFALIPIASCGGCIAFANSSSISNGKGDVGPMFMFVPLALEGLSITAGIGLLLYNLIKGRQ